MSQQGRRRKRKHGSRRLKRLLIVGAVLGLLVIVGLGVRHFVKSGSGREHQERANRAHAAMKAGDYSTARLLYEELVDELPQRLSLRQNLTTCYMQLERFGEARECATRVIEISPAFAPAHLVLSTLCERDGDYTGAVHHAREAVAGRRAPKNVRLHLAKLLLRSGSFSEAVATLAEVVAEDETADEAVLLLAPFIEGTSASDSTALRVRERIRQYLSRAKAELEKSPGDPQKVAACVRLAMLANKPEEARALLEQVEESRELTPQEKEMFSAAAVSEGNLAQAKEYMNEAVGGEESSLTPGQAAAGWLRAREPAKALAAVERGLEDAPRSIALHRIRLRALWQMRDGRGAPEDQADTMARIEAAATELLAVLPTDEQALLYRGSVRLERGSFPGCLEDAEELRRIAPRSGSASWLLGLAYLHMGMPRLALDRLEAGRAAAPTPESASRWILRAAIRSERTRAAQREAPSLPDARDSALRAAALALAGDLDEAEAAVARDDFRRCPMEDRVRLALALAARGRPALAKSIAEELRPFSGQPGVPLRIAELLTASGETEKATAAFEMAAKAGGTAGIRALLVLGEKAILARPCDQEAVDSAIARLKEVEGGALFARLLEGRAALSRGDPDEALAAAREAEESPLPLPAARALALAALRAKGVTGEELERAADAVLEVAPGNKPAREISAAALVRGIRAELGRGELREAEDRATEFLELQPNLAGAQMLRGLIRAQIGDGAEAEEDAQALIEGEDSRGAGHLLMGMIRHREGALEEAAKSFRLAVDAEPESPAALTALGLTLIATGRAEEALPLADRCLAVDEGGVRALTIRVGALVALERLPEAVAVLDARVDEKPEALRARMLRGRIRMLQGDFARASLDFSHLVEKAPKLPIGYSNLVAAELGAGSPERALAAAEAATRQGLVLVGLLLRAHVARVGGDPDEEISILTGAVEKFPEDAAALEVLGTRLIESGSTGAGLEYLQRAAALSPRSVSIRVRLGMLAEREGRISDAVRWYEEILDLQPGHPEAANNLAYRLIENPATRDRAIGLATMAAERVPGEGEFRDTLALALSAAGRHEEAIRTAEAAVGLLPNKASIAITAARVYKAAGRREDAARAAARAQQLAGDAEQETIRRQILDLRLGSGR